MAAPSQLYKFVDDIDAIDSLLDGNMKFTRKEDLNDPSEFIPEYSSEQLADSLKTLRQRGHTKQQLIWLQRQGALMSRLCPEFQALPVPTTVEEADAIIHLPFYEQLESLKIILFKMAETISGRIGVQCLAEQWATLPMWAHYAGNGNGFVMSYKGLDQAFEGDDTGLLNRTHSVLYHREQQGITFDPQSYMHLFFSKFQDWSYEKEWRIILPLTDCQECRVSAAKVIHMSQIAVRHIDSVILGWGVSAENIMRVKTAIKTRPIDVELFQAKFDIGGLTKLPV